MGQCVTKILPKVKEASPVNRGTGLFYYLRVIIDRLRGTGLFYYLRVIIERLLSTSTDQTTGIDGKTIRNSNNGFAIKENTAFDALLYKTKRHFLITRGAFVSVYIDN